MLQPGDRVPHFEVTTLDGARVRYAEIWQRKNLLLLALPGDEPADGRSYVTRLAARVADATADDTELVVTVDHVPGVDRPGVVVADRWGEIGFAVHGRRVAELPSPDEIDDWLRSVRHQCPECEGEAR